MKLPAKLTYYALRFRQIRTSWALWRLNLELNWLELDYFLVIEQLVKIARLPGISLLILGPKSWRYHNSHMFGDIGETDFQVYYMNNQNTITVAARGHWLQAAAETSSVSPFASVRQGRQAAWAPVTSVSAFYSDDDPRETTKMAASMPFHPGP